MCYNGRKNGKTRPCSPSHSIFYGSWMGGGGRNVGAIIEGKKREKQDVNLETSCHEMWGREGFFFAFRDPPSAYALKNVFFATRLLFLCLCVIFCPRRVRTISSDFSFFLRPLANQPARNRKKRGTLFLLSPPSPERLTVFFDFQTSIQSAFEGSIVVIPLPCLFGCHRFKEEKVHFRHSGRAFPLILQVCYSKGIPPLP